MPTNTNAYNSRVTDEALEKRFRDTFRSQGGAELVDDLYAQGVIVPVVDFTQAATGDVLAENLQTAWDFSTGNALVTAAGTVTHISNAGFWKVDWTASGIIVNTGQTADLEIFDGTTAKPFWQWAAVNTGANAFGQTNEGVAVVFLRAGDSMRTRISASNAVEISIAWRQIATVNGDLVNPFGFTSS